MHRLVIRSDAQADIDDAADWYEGERHDLSARFLQRLSETLARVSENPFQFPVIGRGVRRALLEGFPYGVYFVVDRQRAIVLAVLHLRRSPDTWKRRI